MIKPMLSLIAAALTLAACGQSATGGGDSAARQEIRIVGSSTVYPFTQAVAEHFAQANPNFRPAVVESTGTGAGLNLFCGGVGAGHPDIADASRRIKASEFQQCATNGVHQILEVPIGIDGLALIESSQHSTNFALTPRDIYMALAANPFGHPQAAHTWHDVNPALPAVAIRVYGPPPTSGTRDSFADLILEKGCDTNPAMVALKTSDSDRHKQVCTHIREDGAYIEAGENDNLLLQRVAENAGSIGVLGYSYLEQNADRVRGIPINGITPTAATIQNFTYPGSRKLYLYVKGEHLSAIPGLHEFLAAYAGAWNPGGYLVQRGLIPLPDADRQAALALIQNPRFITAADVH
jgi:phosphate transport system substrate-binding protein